MNIGQIKFSVVAIFSLLFICPGIKAQYLTQPEQTTTSPLQYKVFRGDTLYFARPRLFNNLKKVPDDMWQLAKSPFQKTNLTGLVAVGISTAALIIKDQSIIDGVRKVSDNIGLDPDTKYDILVKAGQTKIIKLPLNLNTGLYQLGEGGTSMLLAAGIWVYGKFNKDYRALNTATDLAETFVTLGITTQIMKRISGRESPFMSTRPGGKWSPFPSFSEFQTNTSAYDAFPSGHLSTLMATITVLRKNYPEKRWITPVGYSIMALSAWAMMNTEVHWAGDYPLAIAIGYISGKITTLRHKRKPVIKRVQL